METVAAASLFGPEDERIDREIDAERYNAGSAYAHRGFDPVRVEHSHAPVSVLSGELPADLEGVYIRNGTNVQFDRVHTRAHTFNGAGMLHQVQLRGGRATYSNTYVRTPRFEFERQAGREVFPSYGDMSSSGKAGLERLKLLARKQAAGLAPKWSGLEANPASTSVQHHHGELYCLQGSGLPFVLNARMQGDRLMLDGSGRLQDWGGRFRVPFSAHPRIDPVNGDFYNVSLDARARSIFLARIHEGGLANLQRLATLPAHEPILGTIHDYFLTENYLVIADVSLRFDERYVHGPGGSFWNFEPGRNLRWGLLPRHAREGDGIRWFETANPGMIWHVINGWEETGPDGSPRIVLYAPVFGEYPPHVPIHTPEEPHAKLTKWVLDLSSGKVNEKRLLEHGYERPSANLAYAGRRNRYGYLLDEEADGYMGKGVLKYDLLEEREVKYVSYGDYHGGEALFVPRQGARDEDEGYLLDLLMAADHAELLVLDARSMEEVARLRLPARVPFGVHACWLGREELGQLKLA